MTLEELLVRLAIGEDQDIEFKSADGGLPKSMWETVSAFANTGGGFIVLGVEEKDGELEVRGVRKPEKILQDFWAGHNNPQKLSAPICSQSDIEILSADDKKVIVIRIPVASRVQRPVFINGNPLIGSYKRNYQGDFRCTEAEVRQMLRDASDAPQDALILDHFDLNDLDRESLDAYRNRFASRDPDHPYLALNEFDFLERLGALRRDRNTNEEGLTIAGLLMFGRERSLLEAFPRYHLDYQERFSKDPEIRWTYRLTIDGKWEPNLFNFYYRAYPRLVEGLDIPFKLDKDSVRLGETHVHEALREALVNTLVHADHLASRAITIIKQPDAIIFTNPGRLRIPREVLYQGGVSDPRNPNLQKMFQFLGLGEKAGSGFQKILRAWKEQQWLIPLVAEHPTIEMTRVYLSLASMIPEAVEAELRTVVGDAYLSLQELDRVILMLAHRFGELGNVDIQTFRREHPRDIGDRLKFLVCQGWLQKAGHGRGTRYQLPTEKKIDFPADFSAGSEHYKNSSEHYSPDSEQYDSEQYKHLKTIAAPIRAKGRTSKGLVEKTIIELCLKDWLSLRTLSQLLNRGPNTLRVHYINPMLTDGRLKARFPASPNHPNQAYKTKLKEN
jgi:ATP-dependent DNA helicase RecG